MCPGRHAQTIVYIILGITSVFSHVSYYLFRFSTPFFAYVRGCLERVFPPEFVEIDDELYVVPRHPLLFYTKNLTAPITCYLILQLGFAGCFVAAEQGVPLKDDTTGALLVDAENDSILAADWTYDAAIYHCFVTSTTVGYGDTKIRTNGVC